MKVTAVTEKAFQAQVLALARRHAERAAALLEEGS